MSIRCGYVGLIGLPNVGKSSFLNNVLKEDLSIVSNKPQTTRKTFTGIYSDKEKQIIFLDAPGFVESKAGLFDFMAGEFEKVLNDADHMMVVVANDQKSSSGFEQMWELVKGSRRPWSLLVTKMDLPGTEFVESLVAQATGQGQTVFSINNRKPNMDQLQNFLQKTSLAFESQKDYFFSPDEISPWNLRELAGEWVREACFEKLEQEIPYGLAVKIVSFKEEPTIVRVHATIVVDKENHKSIVIGQGGAMLKAIGQQARKKMEEVLGQKVFLQTHVSLRKNWQKNKTHMKEFGYGRSKA